MPRSKRGRMRWFHSGKRRGKRQCLLIHPPSSGFGSEEISSAWRRTDYVEGKNMIEFIGQSGSHNDAQQKCKAEGGIIIPHPANQLQKAILTIRMGNIVFVDLYHPTSSTSDMEDGNGTRIDTSTIVWDDDEGTEDVSSQGCINICCDTIRYENSGCGTSWDNSTL